MGQQQLLLIVLGTIIVGIAIIVGINIYNAQSISSNRDAVIADLNNIAIMAMAYYKKPVQYGGGGNVFTGWSLPKILKTNSNGKFTTSVKAQSITITGTGLVIGNDNKTNVKATATVTPNAITIKINN